MSAAHNPTHAVILAAGLGSRLHPRTRTVPKPLVAVNGTPILHNALRNLAATGITEAAIVVGYRQDAIRRACGDTFAGTRITYVESSVFDLTGSAYSLWLARDVLLQGETLLLEGDVFFERGVLERLLAAPPGDTAAVAAFDGTMAGTAVTLKPDGTIADFRTNQTQEAINGAALFKTMNLYRLTAPTLRRHLVPCLERLVRSGATKAFVEDVLADLVVQGDIRLSASRCDDLRWFEIDCEADLRTAERIFPRQLDPLYRHRITP